MKATPKQAAWTQGYGAGYQQALADIAQQFENGGEAAAREWIETNRQGA
jgi:hypothetical protein